MSDTIAAPYPYLEARTPSLRYSFNLTNPQGAYETLFDAINLETNRLETTTIVCRLLDAFKVQLFPECRPVARLEFIRKRSNDPKIRRFGLVLFDDQGQAQLHIKRAFLGLSGVGSQLTQLITSSLGISQIDYELMNGVAKKASDQGKDYLIVFSRETPQWIDDVETTALGSIEANWTYWSCQG